MNEVERFNNENVKQTFFGILSGIINVTIFNPFDRALNLATKNHTSIFLPEYWKPYVMYQGMHHGIIQRTISYGLWYPIVEIVKIRFDKIKYKNNYIDTQVLASMCASGLIGLLTSPVSATKQQYWNNDQKQEMFKFIKEMYKKGGFYAFVRGTTVTIKRDMLFGLIFGYLSFTHNKEKKIWIDAPFATLATVASSPFNYIRVMKYKTECNVHISSLLILKDLIKIVKKECKLSLPKQIIYTFHHKFNVGWGSMRVGCGMALSRQLYEYFK
jgi:hypothetical protein